MDPATSPQVCLWIADSSRDFDMHPTPCVGQAYNLGAMRVNIFAVKLSNRRED
jgi:hypothetical protein